MAKSVAYGWAFGVWCGLLGCCFGSLGCSEDKSAMIEQKVQERVSEFRDKKKAECRQQLWEKAESLVDSILLAEAQQALQDSLARLRPFRPAQPPEIQPIDSAAVVPLFRGGN